MERTSRKSLIYMVLAFLSLLYFTSCDETRHGGGSPSDDPSSSPSEPLTIQFTHPSVARAGEPYMHRFRADGGTPPYRDWRVVAGTSPDGLSLDPQTGWFSGKAAEEERLYYFVLEVRDSAPEPAAAREAFGIRVGDPGTTGPLLAKARAFQAVYDARHNIDGLSVTADTPDDPDGNYGYSDLGDACFIHGNASEGAAFWYAVEPMPEALTNARLHTRGLDLLNRVNGIPGLLSRSYMPRDAPMAPGEFTVFWPENDDHEGEGEFAGYYWKGDVSKDQYSGALVGLAMLYDLVPDEAVRSTVRRNIVEIADYLWDGDLIVYDWDGEPTKYGDFRGEVLEGYPIPDGLGAAASLAWFKLAHHVSGAPRFADHYDHLVYERDYVGILGKFMLEYLGYSLTKHYNIYMAFENMFTLTRLEEDPDLHEAYSEAFRRLLWESAEGSLQWRRTDVEENPVKTPWYLFSTGRRDPSAIIGAVRQLDYFVDAPLRDRTIKNSENPWILKNPERTTDALFPLPADLRVSDMNIWHRSPYGLDGVRPTARERTGADYLHPYWMGRYYGYISADW